MMKCSFHLILILFSIAAFIIDCSKNDNPIVARLGQHTISLTEFREAYLDVLKQPDKNDSKKLRESFLDEMINRRLLADQARKNGIAEDERLQFKIEAYKNKWLRDEHYQQVIAPKIHINDALVKKTYLLTREQRRVKHLFFETKARADSAYEILQQGVTFDELAKMIFKDSSLARSGGDLGWVQFDQMEYDLATTAFTLQLNKISPPVRSTYGYHLLKIVDWKKDPFIAEEEFQRDYQNTHKLLESKIGEKIAYEYIDEMMSRTKIQVRSDAVKFVGDKLNKLISESMKNLPERNLSHLMPGEMETIEAGLWEMRNEPMIFIDGETVTIGQFISHLPYIPQSAFQKSYKTVLDFAIRDFNLIQQAKNIGLEQSKTVLMKTNLFEEYLVQLKLRKKIIDNIQVTDSEIEQKYRALTEGKKINFPFKDYREVLARQIVNEKKTTAVSYFIRKLKQDLTIEKNVGLIHEYYKSISGK